MEAEFRLLEIEFSNPGFYKGPAEIARAAKRHHELKESIPRLAEEWEFLSHRAEELKTQFESAREQLQRQFQDS